MPSVPPSEHDPVIGRLAPSPTGALHLGNARSFLLAWLSARQQHGAVLLRIEDIDSPRVKSWATVQTVDDLLWLGLDWDAEGPLQGTESSASSIASSDGQEHRLLIQTSRLERYQSVLDRLIADDLVYACTCSRSDIESAATAARETGMPQNGAVQLEGTVYPGTCRGKQSCPELLPERYSWRWRFQPGQMQWFDRVVGIQVADPEHQLGDFVVARVEAGVAHPSYQLAVVVDDFDQRVNEVVRGDDLIASTFRQLAILEHLGWPVPLYAHVPLIVGADGRKLAKRHGDTRIAWFREAGVKPQALIGFLAASIGLLPAPKAISPQELIGCLDWTAISREKTRFELATDFEALRTLSGF